MARKNPRRYQRWTLDELREVESHVTVANPSIVIARMLGRSINAIRHAMQRRKNGLRVERQTLTVHGHRAIASAFGVGERTAYRWVCIGWIDGTYDRIERFIRNPKYWPFWEIDHMTNPDLQAIARRYRGQMEWLTPEHAAPLYGLSERQIQRLAQQGRVEAEFLANGKWIIRRPSC